MILHKKLHLRKLMGAPLEVNGDTLGNKCRDDAFYVRSLTEFFEDCTIFWGRCRVALQPMAALIL